MTGRWAFVKYFERRVGNDNMNAERNTAESSKVEKKRKNMSTNGYHSVLLRKQIVQENKA